MTYAFSTGTRVGIAVLLGLSIQGALFSALSMMTASTYVPEMIKTTRIEFTRMKTDTDVKSRREEKRVEQPRLDQLPETPPMEIAKSDVDVSMPSFAPTIDMSAALKSVNVEMGMESDILPVMRVPPVYPRNAKLAKIQGYVRMEVVINPDGSVDDIKVLEATPPRMFDVAAVTAMKQWRFKPKLVNGVAVSQRAQQTIEFKLEG